MRLTWRDGVETVLLAGVVAVTLAVTQGWGWPLLGSERAGVAVLAVIGYAMCVLGGSRTAVEGLIREPRGHASVAVLSAFGALALVLVVVGLLVGTQAMLVALAITLAVLWAITTARHGLTGSVGPRARLGTG
jgi:hypothetical protein